VGSLLLRKLAAPETLEEVEGDLLELFMQWQKEHGDRRARLRYILTVFTLLRPFKKTAQLFYHTHSVSTFVMIRSYFKTSWRTLVKNRVSAVIKHRWPYHRLTTSILILLVVMKHFQYDQFHSNLRDIYLLMKNQNTNDGLLTGTSTAGPMAEAMRAEFPEVRFARAIGPF
jgi:putative ABC transport system permease protein